MSESAPGFWMDETSGMLRPVVLAYLRGDDLTVYQVSIIRAYLRQWIAGSRWRGEGIARLRSQLNRMHTRRQVEEWLDLALEQGIDPL